MGGARYVLLPVLFCLKGVKKMNKHNSKDRSKRIINKQIEEIESLKKTILKLEASCNEKDEIINSIDSLRNELVNTIEDIKKKSEEYDQLIGELAEMRKAMNRDVFKGRWNLIRLMLK